jgi:Ni/Co efflux regulator RcnB
MEVRPLFKKTISSLILLGVCSTPFMAFAAQDDHHDAHNQQYVRHDEWKKGYHMKSDDWNRAERVDNYRDYHLSAPPRGYEWREVDGNYVLAAVATGVIASVVAASVAH